MRGELSASLTVTDAIILMGEGIPGALNVLTEIAGTPMGVITIMILDDMNIRGGQIWAGYNDFCGRDLDKFIGRVTGRDDKLIGFLNLDMSRPEGEIVVKSGASLKRYNK